MSDKDLYAEIKARKKAALGKKSIVEAVEHDGRLLVVQGKYDKPDKVLQFAYAKVKDEIRPSHVPKYKNKLAQYDLIVLGCPCTEIPKVGVSMFRDYVIEDGGWILSTDWCVRAFVEQAFPGYVHWNGQKTEDVVVPCHLTQPDHPILDGIASALKSSKFSPDSKSPKAIKAQMLQKSASQTFSWWLEDKSFPIVIDRPDDVVELIHSNEIAKKWGAGCVLCYFDVGKKGGRVFVMISHTHLQKGGTKGKYVSANLLTNILDERVGIRKGLIDRKKKGSAPGYVDYGGPSKGSSDFVTPQLGTFEESDYEVWSEDDFMGVGVTPESQNVGDTGGGAPEMIGTSQIVPLTETPAASQKCALGDGTFIGYGGKMYKCKECGAPYHDECLKIQLSEGVCKICGRIILL